MAACALLRIIQAEKWSLERHGQAGLEIADQKRGSSTQGIPSGKEHLAYVTNSVTLLSGERDVVLVDTFLFEDESKELVDWVTESGKNLTAI